ncbi:MULTISPECIES: assimilatory sulfite reductase (NADPH) hemoprotein subunit [Shewanella]|uniref:Sulfite reductase [NADPH] hemoprotein beta-component n=1 Tax=bacterium 19NY03SH02 TaxID=2920631 RepID=A0AAU6V274_UNCXX|nr:MULTISPECIES: assimilatory sulfite reductase (NADPH) hemoprotein subunit [Shewanella]MBO2564064.1 assimilatory sulfite reductase (NADPH) hemoprotein subunit [Shewanella algae]MBO2585503.1 assimilatory sulfite reductase (NADPH) hemoprotein subunit [Shewanella algae]MBO2589801.1 assimilatory sulfite reductase (NADPH) hemoprotein subunit [Shewanella algae]MBO2661278.1 assimilatory sulfite reductase (NADPH) hemoprotein subunit [Shewanella algae]MBO2673929.1 assimilatory sulfite reductase (NADPH
MSEQKLSANEHIKTDSDYLRGTIREGLGTEVTGAFSDDDQQLIKFHGFYQQDDRDLRNERKEQKLEPLYSFMLRARVPGGVCTPEQWLGVDKIASELTSSNSIRLTTRQTFQYHGIPKRNLKTIIQGLDREALDSIAACGDVNRNVMCNPNPVESKLHQQAYFWAKKLSDHLLPHTRAYAEIWLDEEKLLSTEDEQPAKVEPVYGKTYLPRKFKMAVAVPPDNDVDVYTNDLGFIAVAQEGELVGFNLVAGGGMGSTHGEVETFPRLADDFGFIKAEDTIKFAEAVMTVQRDWGNRSNRKRSRLKYTIVDHGFEAFKAEVEKRAGVKFAPKREVVIGDRGDRYGWVKGIDNHWHLTLFIEGGRVKDTQGKLLQTGLREIAKIHKGDFRMTSNQNIIIAKVADEDKAEIEALARKHGLMGQVITATRGHSIACVALPTCALAMAEAERYFPEFIDHVDALQAKHAIGEQAIVVRMTGCPNGCARPFAAEIGFVGKAPGRYNMYLGASFEGTRLNKMYRENIQEAEILSELDALFGRYAAERETGESFGDFTVRAGIVKPVLDAARDFHG